VFFKKQKLRLYKKANYNKAFGDFVPRVRETKLFFAKNERRPTNVGQSKFFVEVIENTIKNSYSLKKSSLKNSNEA